MNLRERVDALKKDFENGVPKQAPEIMHRATEELKSTGILDRTVQVGDKAPKFTLKNTKGPVVLVFYRGRWGPYCDIELEALAKVTTEIEAHGASLVLISPQLVEHNLAAWEEKGLDAEILSDPDNEVAESYEIRFEVSEDLKKVYQQFKINLEEYNGDESWTLPMPTRLIIDRDSTIRHAEISPD